MSGFLPFDFEDLVARGDATRIVPSSESGWTTYADGRVHLPSGTNYITNPSFETDTNADGYSDGWYISCSGEGTLTCSRIAGRVTGYAQKVEYTAHANDSNEYLYVYSDITAGGTFALNDPITHAFYYTLSITGGGDPRTYSEYFDASTYTGNSTVESLPLATTMSRFSQSATVVGATTTRARMTIRISNIGAGDTISLVIDDALIDKSGTVTPYFDGSYPGCAWTGTAHASTSTRTASALQYPSTIFPTLNEATVALAITPLVTNPNYYYASGRNIYYWVASNERRLSTLNNSGLLHSVTVAHVAGRRDTEVFRWSDLDGSRDISVQAGGSVTEMTHTTGQAIQSPASGVFAIGGGGGSNLSGTMIGPVLYSSKRKSNAWTSAIQANSGAAFSNPMRMWTDFMEPGDILLPLKQNSVGYQKTNGASSLLPTGLDYSFTGTAASTDTGYEVYSG